jgi:hemerythrin
MEDIIFLIDELLESVLIHLETEEEVLRMVNYPNSNVHKDIHENYLKNIQKIYNDASVKDIHKLIIYLKEWWINHILNEDKEYKDYVLSKGYK